MNSGGNMKIKNYKSNLKKRPKHKTAKLLKLLFISVLSIYVFTLLPSIFNLWINISSSIPYGVYKRVDKYPQKEDYILFCLEDELAKVSVERRYTTTGYCSFQSAPIGKKVVAAQGDLVKISKDGIEVNGKLLSNTRPSTYDLLERKMPEYSMYRYLDNNEFIVASTKENSYDSRYFGIVRGEQIKGVIEMIIPS